MYIIGYLTNHLKDNTSKTKYLMFLPNSPKFSNLSLKIFVGKNSQIERVNQYKYLGLIIDDKLNWKAHIQHLKSKLSKALGLLFRVRRYLTKRSLLLLFHSLFNSHLQYGILCWARCSKTAMQPLINLFNKVIKCINFKDFQNEDVLELMHKDKILHINELFKLELAKFMFRYVNRLLPTNFDIFFVPIANIHNYHTRASTNNFFIPRRSKNKSLGALSFLGSKLWSEIPNNIKVKPSLFSFTSNYKNHLLNNNHT